MTTQNICPCGQGQYATCCQPLHQHQKKAKTAEQLMRSRYSAFAKQQIDYLVKTTALLQQPQLNITAISDWSNSNHWQKLEVVQHQAKINKYHASVEFKAYYHDGKNNQCHHEKSFFVQLQDTWYFLDPTLDQYPTLKQPCVCGSGKKFKHCCAEFIA